jgi:ankyrin repeat protein
VSKLKSVSSYHKNGFFEAERLHRAAADGNTSEVESLIASGFNINLFDDLGRTPLHYAVENINYKTVLYLISMGADVNAHDEANIRETPLYYAVQSNSIELVELLLQHGADPDILGWMGFSVRTRVLQRKDEDGQLIARLINRYRPLLP